MPTQESIDRKFIQQSIRMAVENVKQQQGGPFAAIIVKNNEIIATGTNVVTTTDDPTAHAEISAIRAACKKLHTFELEDCTIYSSCEPCPMCLGAIYWAHLSRLVFAADKKQAAEAGFDDDFIYKEIDLTYEKRKLITSQILTEEGEAPFEAWRNNDLKITY
ncbi:MAG: nucleoside deaminase [Bacteroidales bacterium]|jgi:guanine deaminase|nr:nucleoside deaminase [Bacteroidales bacterium]MDD3329757.1 nucleoside deaminase [Bacteroidales bacterium]MDD3690632.1 nucleoside deaminase [Bacteroidales bacterium]MDD4045039.1 nucleoside deaminase [Bacteroidales bacterium]NLO42397.1 nucleoside deaminase [Bacteroidales bacterium]